MPESYITKVIKRADRRQKWREDRQASEKVLSKRQQRYATDPDYRKSIKESVRRRREARDPSDRKRSFNRDKIIVINGVSVSLWSSGKSAQLVGVTPKTLKNWGEKGIIPQNITKDRLGRHWYPSEFIMFLAEQAENRPKGRLDEWSNRVKEAWQEVQLSDRPIPVVGNYLEDHNE
jgi:hypothetical protein